MEPKEQTIDGIKETISWVDHDAYPFYTHQYHSLQQPPLASLTIVHGLGEHIDRYEEMARMFAKAGIQVIGFDQRGFGKTGRQSKSLGKNQGIDTVSQDIAFFSSLIAQENVPHFLYGHSMGGLNVLHYCLNRNQDNHVRGVIASAPALLPGKPLMPSRFVEWTLYQVAKVVPNVQKNTGITTDMLTSNQREVEKFNAAIENIGHCTLGTLANVLKGGNKVIQNAEKFSTPVYLVHADGDMATNCEGTQKFFDKLPQSLDKELKEVKNNQYHELHFEENLDFDLLDTYKQWILKRCSSE